MTYKDLKITKESVYETLSLLSMFLFMTNFLFGLGHVPSSSMEPTLMPGDLMIKDVVSVGGTTPEIPLQVPVVSNLWDSFYLDWIRLPRFRVVAAGSLERGDVVIFKNVMDSKTCVSKREDFVKRLVGLPKDEVQITECLVYVNGLEDIYNACRQFVCVIKTKEPLPDAFLRSIVHFKGSKVQEGDKVFWLYTLTMTYAQVEEYHRLVDQNNIQVLEKKFYKSERSTGLENDMKPCAVPYKGYTISLDKDTHLLYVKTLESKYGDRFRVVEEGEEKVFYLDGCMINSYTFEEDFLFMKGDNTHNSVDSTQFGCVPKSYVCAKARVVLLNTGKERSWLRKLAFWNWKRFFKMV